MESGLASTSSRQHALLSVAHDLSRAEHVDQMLDRILQCSREVMACEVCSILLPEGGSGDLLIRSTLDVPGAPPIRVPKGKGIASAVYDSKQTLNLADARQDPRHFAHAGSNSGLVTQTMLTIPLLDGDKALGVMQAINPRGRALFDDGDAEMFETFGSLVAVALIRLEAQRNAIRDAQRSQQLELAHEIQRSFLPPSEATLGEIAIQAFYEPASEIGGDFYFWHELEGGEILLGVADVCGKGFPASLDMARGSTLIASLAYQASRLPLGDWVSLLNSRLCGVMTQGRFIAATFAVIRPKTRHISLCVAGSLPPLHFNAGGWFEASHTKNPPLGISCSLSYRADERSLALGRTWLFLTDGIQETQNEQGEYFEDGAFGAALSQASHGSGIEALKTLRESWKSFAKAAAYQDDVTLLSFTGLNPEPPSEFGFNCNPETIKQARDYFEQWSAYAGFDDTAAGMVVLACDEVCTNVCRHAYATHGCAGPALCRVGIEGDCLSIEFQHHGTGIANDELPPLPENPCAKVGGLGLGVIRQVFDHVDYIKGEEASTIFLKKRLP